MLLFGTDIKNDRDAVFEYVLVIMRYYIYKCTCEESFPTLGVFQAYLKNKFEIEKHIAQSNNQFKTKFELKWAVWMDFVNTCNTQWKEKKKKFQLYTS